MYFNSTISDSTKLLKPVLVFAFAIAAALTGLTQITQHRSHPIDVYVGFLIGAFIAAYLVRSETLRPMDKYVYFFHLRWAQSDLFSAERRKRNCSSARPVVCLEDRLYVCLGGLGVSMQKLCLLWFSVIQCSWSNSPAVVMDTSLCFCCHDDCISMNQ